MNMQKVAMTSYKHLNGLQEPALIIRNSAAGKVSLPLALTLYSGLKRWRCPQLQRVHWLHIYSNATISEFPSCTGQCKGVGVGVRAGKRSTIVAVYQDCRRSSCMQPLPIDGWLCFSGQHFDILTHSAEAHEHYGPCCPSQSTLANFAYLESSILQSYHQPLCSFLNVGAMFRQRRYRCYPC